MKNKVLNYEFVEHKIMLENDLSKLLNLVDNYTCECGSITKLHNFRKTKVELNYYIEELIEKYRYSILLPSGCYGNVFAYLLEMQRYCVIKNLYEDGIVKEDDKISFSPIDKNEFYTFENTYYRSIKYKNVISIQNVEKNLDSIKKIYTYFNQKKDVITLVKMFDDLTLNPISITQDKIDRLVEFIRDLNYKYGNYFYIPGNYNNRGNIVAVFISLGKYDNVLTLMKVLNISLDDDICYRRSNILIGNGNNRKKYNVKDYFLCNIQNDKEKEDIYSFYTEEEKKILLKEKSKCKNKIMSYINN